MRPRSSCSTRAIATPPPRACASSSAITPALRVRATISAERGEELDFALELAKDAQRIDSSPEVFDTLGWVHYQRGEYADAITALEAALAGKSNSPSVRYRLGRALQQAGNPERAREMLQSAIAAGSFPEAEDARRQLAQLTGG